MTKKLQKIYKKNAELEKDSPYNFCDRWCERCPDHTQGRCRLYLDELDRKVTNIAHGRDEDDMEIFQHDLEHEFNQWEYSDDPWIEDDDIEDSEYDEDLDKQFNQIREEVDHHALMRVTKQYTVRSHEFLKYTYFDESRNCEPKFDWETVAWYHSLLSAKMNRALFGLISNQKRMDDEEEYELCDAVAQFAVCGKGIHFSIEAYRKIREMNTSLAAKITPLIALLHNMASQIKIIEKDI